MLSHGGSPRALSPGPRSLSLNGAEYAPLPTSPGGVAGGGASCQPWCVQRWLEGDFSIIPDELWFERWDVVLIVSLCFTAVLLPLDVSLLKSELPFVNSIMNVTDVVFLSDLLLHFNIGYSVKNPLSKGEKWELRPLKIATRYMAFPFSENMQAGWFWPDMVTLMPWDHVVGLFAIDFSSLRIMKLLRLLRILRLVRVVKLFKKWHTRVGMSMALLKIATCAILTLLLTHWLACLWAHMGQHPESYGHEKGHSWLAHYFGNREDVATMSAYEVYYSALYFCTVVLTTVGFGDVIPVNHVEVIIMTITVWVTGVTWAWVVGNIVNVITNLDTFGNLFNTAMDDLNSLMHANSVGMPTRLRIRKHLHESYLVQKQRHARESFIWLSEGLKGELAIQSGVDKICNCVWYFRDLPEPVIIELADEFQANFFSPNETVMSRDSTSVIMRGSCLKNGRLLTREGCYGEDMILCSQHLRDPSCPLTLSFMEVMTINREDMMEACHKYPDFNLRMRRAQVKLAVWRAFILEASKLRVTNANLIRSRKRRSAWDNNFFDIGKKNPTGFPGSNIPVRPGWRESFTEEKAEDVTLLDPQQGSNAQFLEAIQSMRDNMAESNLDTQRCLLKFEGRFDQLQNEVTKVNTKVEALSQEFHRVLLESPGKSSFFHLPAARAKPPKV